LRLVFHDLIFYSITYLQAMLGERQTLIVHNSSIHVHIRRQCPDETRSRVVHFRLASGFERDLRFVPERIGAEDYRVVPIDAFVEGVDNENFVHAQIEGVRVEFVLT
jgi:hypothetical protein